MDKCKHIIGQIYNYENTSLVSFDDIVKIQKSAEESYEFWNRDKDRDLFIEMAEKQLKHSQVKNYLDKRKGYMKHFNFCPECGEKIEWQKFRKEIT